MRELIVVVTTCFMLGCSAVGESDYALQLTESRIQQAYKRGDLTATEALLRNRLKQQGSDSASWLMLGQVLMRTHDYAAAQQAYETATRLDPAHGPSWYHLAISHLRLATEALIEADGQMDNDAPLPLLLWLLELQTGKPMEPLTL
ncbi:tetratricopeptide repeat protein [Aliidiomarina quisquiliarum]|uniref:tetratricopeptide repeat protein n=1 Tax=Aliidiomarina quisquiliarum TaxID=2938947 RepID=UPI00208F9D02|nr:tetratricopeptide repeat protein [Aliidiomarina quisquiliarum]MCO4321759.1 tetratricopeptide repeat protein [Aliidiomarina quisquiliarum]